MLWVVKVGSGVLAAEDGTLRRDRVVSIAEQIVELKKQGVDVVLVSSGAIASGFRQLGFETVPESLAERQACASVGQVRLVRAYDEVFQSASIEPKVSAGLVLLTHDDIKMMSHREHGRHTIQTLLVRNAVPIINENDAVAVEEILLGDNDRLSAMVVDLIQADRLIILTNVDGLLNEQGELVTEIHVDHIGEAVRHLDASKSTLGSGGMRSKIDAAKITAQSGVTTMIANGNKDRILVDILETRDVACTVILPSMDSTRNVPT